MITKCPFVVVVGPLVAVEVSSDDCDSFILFVAILKFELSEVVLLKTSYVLGNLNCLPCRVQLFSKKMSARTVNKKIKNTGIPISLYLFVLLIILSWYCLCYYYFL